MIGDGEHKGCLLQMIKAKSWWRLHVHHLHRNIHLSQRNYRKIHIYCSYVIEMSQKVGHNVQIKWFTHKSLSDVSAMWSTVVFHSLHTKTIINKICMKIEHMIIHSICIVCMHCAMLCFILFPVITCWIISLIHCLKKCITLGFLQDRTRR